MTDTARDDDLETLLEFLKYNRGFDFTGYKRTTLQRRIQKRMEAIGVATYPEYLARLDDDGEEYTQLFNTLMINVTSFFRDEVPWESLARQVIPAMIERVPASVPIRIWSAGCASGQEAYTLAMLMAEALGVEHLRERVKIYATDVDEEALAQARLASYAADQIDAIPAAVQAKYLERSDTRFSFRKELRRAVIFGRNDLVQDAPISRVDLLVCRNTLMYFNAATQTTVLGRFHFALAERGVLFLGRAETLLTHTGAFTPLDLKWRMFTKVSRVGLRDRLFLASQGDGRDPSAGIGGRLRETAFEAGAQPQIVVGRTGALMLANERARIVFGIARADLGRPIQDVELSYRPVELRSLLERCFTTREPVSSREVKWRPPHAPDDRWMNVELVPLAEPDGTVIGASIMFLDVTDAYRLQLELEHAKQYLETAYEELQSTNEELETTNEELQSTNEELETTNEELQSTNEELETMNEELQSMNDELQTVNDEMRRRGDELNEAGDFMTAVFESMRGAVVVLDKELSVLVWNAEAAELWGIRAAEAVGASFLRLDIGLPVAELAERLRGALQGAREVEMAPIAARNRRGRGVRVRVTCGPLRGSGGVRGVIVTMEEVEEPAAGDAVNGGGGEGGGGGGGGGDAAGTRGVSAGME